MPTFAIMLSGCGVNDGSEIHEAVSLMLNLAKHAIDYRCFAPDIDQAHVINHLMGEETKGETRNALVEAARIARGDIKPLAELKAADFDALAAPGGFGAAKNLCSFATDGADCTVNPEVERVIKDFHAAGKPIAVCCITPVIVAKVLGTAAGGPGCEVTIGADPATADAIEQMGSTSIEKPVNEAHTDENNKVVTAPAYMYDAKIDEVDAGIAQMVEQTLALLSAAATKA